MSPLDMLFMASVVFAIVKIVQFWVIWESTPEEDRL